MTTTHEVSLPPAALSNAVVALFRQAGSSETEARLVAEQLVGANLAGHDSHGVGMVPLYIDVLVAGELTLNRRPDVVLDQGPLTVLDAGVGLGQVAGHAAMQVAIEKARAHGVSLTGLRNSHHIGRIGHWAEMACAAGLVSIHFVNVIAHPVVAPWGGSDARLVTNPFAIGVPRPRAEPLVLDFATSKLAVGKVRVARNMGKTLPAQVLLDAEGRPTRDPAALFDEPRGALLPFGDHKGSGLALMCEILGSALFGGPVMHQKPGRVRVINNMGTIAIDPARLGGGEALDDQIARLLDWVKASPAAEPPEGVPRAVQVAGEPETRSRRARAAGIPIDGETWRQLTEAAGKVGLDERAFRHAAGLD
jgi:uncharacterized oxidoreductase